MFEDLPEHQIKDLTKVWEASLKAMHWGSVHCMDNVNASKGIVTPAEWLGVGGVPAVELLSWPPRRRTQRSSPITLR